MLSRTPPSPPCSPAVTRRRMLLAITTLITLAGVLADGRRLARMPRFADEPPTAPAPLTESDPTALVTLADYSVAQITALGESSPPSGPVAFSPEGKRLAVSPFRAREATATLHSVEAQVTGFTTHPLRTWLEAPAEGKRPAIAPQVLFTNGLPGGNGSQAYLQLPATDSTWSVRFCVALSSQNRTVAETPLWMPLIGRLGPNLHLRYERGIGNGATGATGFRVHLRLPSTLTARIQAGTAAAVFYGTDWLGNTFPLENRVDSEGKTTLRFFYRSPAAIRSILVVMAPVQKVTFENLPRQVNPNLPLFGVYPIAPKYRDLLRTISPANVSSDAIGQDHDAYVANVTEFPPAHTAGGVRDAVVIGSGTPYRPQTEAERSGKGATFTVFMPRYLDNLHLMVEAADAHGTRTTRYTTERFPDFENGTISCRCYHFPELDQNDVKRIGLYLR